VILFIEKNNVMIYIVIED